MVTKNEALAAADEARAAAQDRGEDVSGYITLRAAISMKFAPGIRSALGKIDDNPVFRKQVIVDYAESLKR